MSSGPILEKMGMGPIFQKKGQKKSKKEQKRAKYLKIVACMKHPEYALVIMI